MVPKATDGQVFENIESSARSRVETSSFHREVTPCPPVLRSSHSEYELRRKAAQGVTSRWNNEVSTRLRTDDSMISKTCPSVALGTTRCVPWNALVACFFQPVRGGSKQKSRFLGLIGVERCRSFGSPYPRLNRRHGTTNPELLRSQGR